MEDCCRFVAAVDEHFGSVQILVNPAGVSDRGTINAQVCTILGRFYTLTDPALIELCFETGHYIFGEGKGAEGVRKHASRIWHFHLKAYVIRLRF